MSVPAAVPRTAVRVCAFEELVVERGSAALVDGLQVAVFRLADDVVHAVSNLDPYSGAHVISRGIVGTRGAAPTIASPMHKQVFDLRTGECLDSQGKDPRHLPVWHVSVEGADVLVAPPASHGEGEPS